MGYTDISVTTITDAQAVLLLGTFVETTALTQTNTQGKPVVAKTLVGYLTAAHLFLEQATGRKIPIHEPGTGKELKLINFLHDTIATRQKWQQPMEKREGYTWDMFVTFKKMVTELTHMEGHHFLDMEPAIYDWIRLGVFTGSRAGEYAQTVVKRGDYARVPDHHAAAEWRNYPIAFVAADFTLFDAQGHVVPHNLPLFLNPSIATELHIRFRFQKNKNNFETKKFGRGRDFLCPVDAAICILRRAFMLGIPSHEPIGAFRKDPTGRYTFLKSQDIISTMRKVVIRTYPDPNHFLRVNISQIVAHSNRITAALALHAHGKDAQDIANRLRWDVRTVKHYLRECQSQIGDLTSAAIEGALAL
jgi:hypothetical protein